MKNAKSIVRKSQEHAKLAAFMAFCIDYFTEHEAEMNEAVKEVAQRVFKNASPEAIAFTTGVLLSDTIVDEHRKAELAALSKRILDDGTH